MVALTAWPVTMAHSSLHQSLPSLLKNGTSNTEPTALATVKQMGKWNQQWNSKEPYLESLGFQNGPEHCDTRLLQCTDPRNGVKPSKTLNEQENTNTTSDDKSPPSAQDTTNRPRNERPDKATSTAVQILQQTHSWLAHPCRRWCRTNETLSTRNWGVVERHSHITARLEILCSGNAWWRDMQKEPLPPEENQRESWHPDDTAHNTCEIYWGQLITNQDHTKSIPYRNTKHLWHYQWTSYGCI